MPLDMDRRLLPVDPLRGCLNRVMRLRGDELLRYGDPEGYRPLRECIARRLQQHCVSVGPEEILITNGSQQALDLIFRMMAAPGRAVAVESPTYGLVFPLLKLSGLKPLEIPMGPEGMDLDVLEAKLRKHPPALVYTMPNFQNPTGRSTSQAHREKLLALRALHERVDPAWATWEEPNGGYLLWLRLTGRNASKRDWPGLFAKHGVQVSFGDQYFAHGPQTPCLRLSIATLDEQEITRGVHRLAAALEEGFRRKS